MMKQVSIIIVNWNGKKFLKMCLPSVKKVNYPNYEVLVVDNGSQDGSPEFIKKYYPWVKLIENTKNLGFAEANNIGFEKSRGDYVLLLNNDVEVEPDFLTVLVKKLESDPKIACVQPKICLHDRKELLDSAGSFLTDGGFLYHFGRLKSASLPAYNQSFDIYSAKGAAMLLRKSVLKRTGLFDSDFFAYFEETDLCHRIWLAGYRVVYEPRAVIYHVVSGTTLKLLSNEYTLWLSLKNRICSFIKNLGLISLTKILAVLSTIYVLLFFFYFLTFKFSLALAITKAIIWNTINLPKTLRKRQFVQQKLRKVKDTTLFSKIKRNPQPKYFWYLLTDNLGGFQDRPLLPNR